MGSEPRAVLHNRRRKLEARVCLGQRLISFIKSSPSALIKTLRLSFGLQVVDRKMLRVYGSGNAQEEVQPTLNAMRSEPRVVLHNRLWELDVPVCLGVSAYVIYQEVAERAARLLQEPIKKILPEVILLISKGLFSL